MESGQWEGGGRPEAGAEQSPWLRVMEGLCLGGEVSGGWPEQLGGWRCPPELCPGPSDLGCPQMPQGRWAPVSQHGRGRGGNAAESLLTPGSCKRGCARKHPETQKGGFPAGAVAPSARTRE